MLDDCNRFIDPFFGKEIPLFYPLAHFAAFRNVLHVALYGPKLEAVQAEKRCEVLGEKKQALQNSPIFTLAITLAVLGIIFGDDPPVGYSLLGTSMVLSVIYAVIVSRKK